MPPVRVSYRKQGQYGAASQEAYDQAAWEGRMTSFSIMDAAVEPFRLAGRRPFATIVWGLVLMQVAIVRATWNALRGDWDVWRH